MSGIWSSGNNSPTQTNTNLSSFENNLQYKSVLDQIDPDVAKFLSSDNINNPFERRLSFNDESDIMDQNQNFFGGFKRGALSAITAPVGGNNNNNNNHQNNNQVVFGTASISGGIANRHPPPQQDSFLQKFSNIGDVTREAVTNGNSRRTSLNNDNKNASASIGLYNGGSNGSNKSLNENLNMPAPTRTSRHQSISEKIDNYNINNNNSPIQTTAKLSLASDSNENFNNSQNNNVNNSNHIPQNFWNPATATSFTPQQNYFIDNLPPHPPIPHPQMPPQFSQNLYRNGQPTANFQQISPPPPPFMIPSPPPPPPQFMDPGLFNMIYGQIPEQDEKNEVEKEDKKDTKVDKEKEDNRDIKNDQDTNKKTPGPGQIGVGLMNRQFSPASFMFHHFNPYSMYQQSPPLVPPPEALRGLSSPPPIPGMQMPPVSHQLPVSPPPNAPQNVQQQQPQSQPSKPAPVKESKKKSNGKNKPTGGGSHIYRSPLLEEVRSNPKNKEFYLKDIYGHAIEFTKDQHGSRFIQQKLPDATEEEKEMIFNEIRDISYELMTDVFGNYVIQKYFEHGSKIQKQILLEQMLGHIYELSLQMYGCRVVQRALEASDIEDGQLKIIEELKDHILICSKDQNGNHVIQKSIERIKPFDKIRFILISLKDQIYHLSTHPYGCRVIQRLLEFSNRDDQKLILSELNKFIYYLIQDQYGNYVMQHILEHGKNEEKEEILKIVLGNVVSFSKHKFASNVIEKCIKFGNKQQRIRILNEVMLNNQNINIEVVNDDSPLALMMKDQYANYVIQKLVEAFDSKSQEKKILVLKLRQYLKQLSNKNNFGGKHLASVEKMIIVAETALDE
ncbi:unnamed protein product [Candida verbasci]|uniref:Pumilio homology domain family member 3 n=1 Tax=Candida verbasci TaxID=1227364 RepID=A0A9W4TYE4_9ASCO|nr:unnamed protein product [Candida verbasci]